jgi:hypothetical protein
VDDDERNYYSQDFLNSITPNGLPPHELRIKINCPLILLHNMDPCNGLCDGTHLVVRAVDKHILDAEIDIIHLFLVSILVLTLSIFWMSVFLGIEFVYCWKGKVC